MISIIVLSLLIFFLLVLRFYLPILLIPSLALGLLLGKGKDQKIQTHRAVPFFDIFFRQSFIIIIFGVILFPFGFHKLIENMVPSGVEDFLKNTQIVRDDLSQRASSGYLKVMDISSPMSALKYLPKGVFYFLTVPLPWQFGSIRQNLVLPEMIFWLFLYPVILLGMKRGLNLNFQGSTLLITITIIMTCYYGLFIGNVGTAYRMRSQIWLFWVIFVGWYHEKKYLKNLRGPSVGK